MVHPVDDTVKGLLDSHLAEIEKYLKADVLLFFGPIQEGSESFIL